MHLCSAGGCIISFEKSNVQIVVYEAVSTRDVEVVLLRHGKYFEVLYVRSAAMVG